MATQQSIAQDSIAAPIASAAASIEQCFEAAFYARYRTRLVGGAEEPEYLAPQGDKAEAIIRYRQDFAASALHEAAHWCIAGEQRRQQNDYGYWYSPDGRDEAAQRQFERVEARPQALEYLFSVCCGLPFRLSVDNLSLPEWDSGAFAESVWQQYRRLNALNDNHRAAQFANGLAQTLRGRHWRQCWLDALQQPAACFQHLQHECDNG